MNPELRATKSIIIGAGQPIVVPGQRPVENRQSNANPLKTASNIMLPKCVSNEANGTIVRPSIEQTALPIRTTINDSGKVTSVEEFCPDGGALDKGFLDDLPSVSNADGRNQTDLNYDSDSDSNDTGNPLVAKFHDDPFDDVSIPKDQAMPSTQAPSKIEPKVNPLAKKQNKGLIPHDLSLVLPSSKRRNSNSSDDIEIPHILNTKTNNHDNSSDGQSNEEFDSWLSDTNQRRSPEGGEDEASLPSIDKSITINTETTKLDRLQLIDGGDGAGANDDDKSTKEKSKSKKKKKEKKEKKDKSDKEKKRNKSKKSTAENLLIEAKDRPSHAIDDVITTADDDQYEAL